MRPHWLSSSIEFMQVPCGSVGATALSDPNRKLSSADPMGRSIPARRNAETAGGIGNPIPWDSTWRESRAGSVVLVRLSWCRCHPDNANVTRVSMIVQVSDCADVCIKFQGVMGQDGQGTDCPYTGRSMGDGTVARWHGTGRREGHAGAHVGAYGGTHGRIRWHGGAYAHTRTYAPHTHHARDSTRTGSAGIRAWARLTLARCTAYARIARGSLFPLVDQCAIAD